MYQELDDCIIRNVSVVLLDSMTDICTQIEVYNYEAESWEIVELKFFDVFEYINKLDLDNNSVIGWAQLYISDVDESVIADFAPYIIPANTREEHLKSRFYVNCKTISFETIKTL
ncbi:hypothetical protein LJ737_02140 [Hymenobacter sp. 15J16-1T3B]|uniref:hypothetical protein n=1 Tax=Hymenobacter sp. 15J16-1T3B TaxID=2886941 RepID=UPI001D0F5C49|nr:hypothetical protein [Hymenobacter sp. 15J16-1T3B]MCC3156015.1 hypothetical protein [Hymenobacter sp. 15J16-1T3B]